MKNKKLLVFGSAAVLALGAIAAVALNKDFESVGTKADASYSLVFDADHKIVDTQIQTDDGNTIWTKDGGVTWDDDSMLFDKGDYIQNLSEIKGITSIDVAMISGRVQVEYTYAEPSDLITLMYKAAEVSASGTVNLPADVTNVRVIALEDSEVESITYNYACAISETPTIKTETDQEYSLETVARATATNGITSIVSNVSCGSATSVEFHNSKLDANSENFTIYLEDAIGSGKLHLPETVCSLSADVMDDNGVIANNDRWGFQAQVCSKAGSTSWMDTINWGVKALEDGWYRLTWDFAEMETADITKIAFYVMRKNSEGQIASTYWFDNVRFYSAPTAKNVYLDSMSVPNDYFDPEEYPMTISFDYWLQPGYNTVEIFIGSDWSNYYGYFQIANGVAENSGVTASKLSNNNWYHVEFELASINPSKINGTPSSVLTLLYCKTCKWAIGNFMVEWEN